MAKIIIVEDEQTIREELASLLTQTGYSVSYLTEFQHASEDILERNPDLVLMDVNLPGTNGLVLCDRIRKKSQVPIIFVTSNNTSMDELNCIMRGGDDYVAKPYQVPILLARIAAVLLIAFAWLFVLGCFLCIVYFQRKRHFDKVERILEQLDRPYLFSEMAPVGRHL